MDALSSRAQVNMINFKTKKRPYSSMASSSSKRGKLSSKTPPHRRGLADLSSDELECVTKNLDTFSNLSLLRTCKAINAKLNNCPGFWRHLCYNENFHEYTALRSDDDGNEEDDDDEDDDRERLTWSLEKFHDVDIADSAPLWRKIFLRGLGMRRNICQGKFELWRLFLTDHDSLPVKKMTKDTSFRELRSYHRHSSKAKDPRRRVRIHRYWNEDFLVAVQHSAESFTDIYVWRWFECQNPRFLYSYDLHPLYPQGLYPTAFFLWKHYLVLMPDTGYFHEDRALKSMIRVHDLDSDQLELVGQFDFADNDKRRRLMRAGPGNETAHMHKLNDKAVALCRTPKLMIFVFNLPDCQLLREISLMANLTPRPLESDDLDQRFLMKDNTMIFMFHDPEFFTHLFNNGTNNQLAGDDNPNLDNSARKYGRLLFVDFESFLKSGGPVRMRIDDAFDCNDDYIERISVMSSDRMAVALNSGKVVIRDIISTSMNTCSYVDKLVIPCPENLKEELDQDLDEIDTDGPSLCSSRNGDIIMVMRHFESGRRIHAYDISREGRVLYTINLDDRSTNLVKNPGYISIDMDGNFVCAADQNKIVIWNARNGKFINTIDIPAHYDVREDQSELQDKHCWKGHTDFAFAEDGIIIIHSQRNFPIAADVMLFW